MSFVSGGAVLGFVRTGNTGDVGDTTAMIHWNNAPDTTFEMVRNRVREGIAVLETLNAAAS